MKQTPDNSAAIAENLSRVRARIHAACDRAGRAADSVRLMAVSKKQPIEAVLAAIAAGQRLFGENYAQEGVLKAQALQARGIAAEIRLIGALQKNKARDAVQWFSAVETLDSPELAARLQGQCERFDKTLPVLLEINLGEAQKAGFDLDSAAALLARARDFPRLKFQGLMAIPPVRADEASARADFMLLSEGFAGLRARYPAAGNISLAELSMGMSHDFELAIACGATEVRVGTAIFGERRS